ncbi:hypothetical protein Patl1_02373 [Pistacia atlantica]|uniref:Uncharacterized protein n=1 Tax=Pistacia atlantica TaxID=434234 RepID=A0ACC1CC07_9ROSI|nr:hypothetical protein Patl1_02373 [Pistacia atlantica]
MDRALHRTNIINNHLLQSNSPQFISTNACLSYSSPELNEVSHFDLKEMLKLLDGRNLEDRDRLFNLITQSKLFNPRKVGEKVFVSPGCNQTMEQQREMTMKRIDYLLEKGVFRGWFTEKGIQTELKQLAVLEVGWGHPVFGNEATPRQVVRDTENYVVKGCFAMTELGHGSNVRGIETITRYDSNTAEFVINTPCESAQRYWIGGAANHATHTVVFSQLEINGKNLGVHAFICQIRDADGNICPNVRIADCGHKSGLNGVDNGRIWFDNVRVPRENLLNSVADVSPDGEYLSAIEDPDKRFAAFLAPLTSGRVTIAVGAVYTSKVMIHFKSSLGFSWKSFVAYMCNFLRPGIAGGS